jgi:hypothetical protein
LHELKPVRRHSCGCIELRQAPSIPLGHSKRRISDRKNIVFIIIFCLILGITLSPPLLIVVGIGIIPGISAGSSLLGSLLFCT